MAATQTLWVGLKHGGQSHCELNMVWHFVAAAEGWETARIMPRYVWLLPVAGNYRWIWADVTCLPSVTCYWGATKVSGFIRSSSNDGDYIKHCPLTELCWSRHVGNTLWIVHSFIFRGSLQGKRKHISRSLTRQTTDRPPVDRAVPRNFHLRGPGQEWALGRGLPPPHWGSALPQNFLIYFRWNWCICMHCLYLKSKLVSRSQLRRPWHEQQRQINVRSNTEAITGEKTSSQDLESTRFVVSSITSTYVLLM